MSADDTREPLPAEWDVVRDLYRAYMFEDWDASSRLIAEMSTMTLMLTRDRLKFIARDLEMEHAHRPE